MVRNSLNRPPRTKRPPEVIRHVDETMDAYRRVRGAAARKDKPAPAEAPPEKPGRR